MISQRTYMIQDPNQFNDFGTRNHFQTIQNEVCNFKFAFWNKSDGDGGNFTNGDDKNYDVNNRGGYRGDNQPFIVNVKNLSTRYQKLKICK